MGAEEDLQRDLAALRASRQRLEKLSRLGTADGRVRVDCVGPRKGKPCPHQAFEFFKRDNAKKLRKEFRCKQCWQTIARRNQKKGLVIADKNGPTKEYLDLLKQMDFHTLRWEPGPNGFDIRIGFNGRPLETKYHSWWELKQTTKETVPAGYFWCIAENFPWKKIKPSCSNCPLRFKCGPFQLHEQKQELTKLQEQLAEIEKPNKEAKKVEAAKRRVAKREKDKAVAKAIEDVLKRF